MNIIDLSGRSIIIQNGSIVVDGKNVSAQMENLTINVHGNVESLTVDACRSVDAQTVGRIKTMSGDVTVKEAWLEISPPLQVM